MYDYEQLVYRGATITRAEFKKIQDQKKKIINCMEKGWTDFILSEQEKLYMMVGELDMATANMMEDVLEVMHAHYIAGPTKRARNITEDQFYKISTHVKLLEEHMGNGNLEMTIELLNLLLEVSDELLRGGKRYECGWCKSMHASVVSAYHWAKIKLEQEEENKEEEEELEGKGRTRREEQQEDNDEGEKESTEGKGEEDKEEEKGIEEKANVKGEEENIENKNKEDKEDNDEGEKESTEGKGEEGKEEEKDIEEKANVKGEEENIENKNKEDKEDNDAGKKEKEDKEGGTAASVKDAALGDTIRIPIQARQSTEKIEEVQILKRYQEKNHNKLQDQDQRNEGGGGKQI